MQDSCEGVDTHTDRGEGDEALERGHWSVLHRLLVDARALAAEDAYQEARTRAREQRRALLAEAAELAAWASQYRASACIALQGAAIRLAGRTSGLVTLGRASGAAQWGSAALCRLCAPSLCHEEGAWVAAAAAGVLALRSVEFLSLSVLRSSYARGQESEDPEKDITLQCNAIPEDLDAALLSARGLAQRCGFTSGQQDQSKGNM